MRRAIGVVLVLAGAAALSSVVLAGHHQVALPKLLTFDHMYGVDGPFIGEASAIRGIPGDELPWTVRDFARGRLDTSGHLQVQVHGLVFTDDPEVPPDLRGRNDEAKFRAVVSCLTETPEGVGTANVTTPGFPATVDGVAFIDTIVDLPNPCIAPVVLVLAGSEDKWFAVTGFESEGEDR